MMKIAIAGLVLACCTGLALAAPLGSEKSYDMLFRNGSLDQIDKTSELIYRRDVRNALKPDVEDRDTGDIALSFQEGEANMALLEFRQDGKHRSLGTFPASVGNPMIMYFYESVVRDMAESAGGSPFYIRNRIKDALIQSTDIVKGEAMVGGEKVVTQTIRMYPFADDPNRERMKGFEDLELSVTMSDSVPGWYMSFVADTSGRDVYKSELIFERLDGAE